MAAFFAWADRLPGRGWWLYPAMAIALLAWSSALLWATGRLPVGTLERLPTWPWPPQLFRGFVSALLLPVVVYLLTRLAGGLIGE